MDLLKIIFERADALNGYWNLYIAVSLGLISVMASGKPFTQRATIKILMTIGFLFFACSNLEVIYHTNGQRRELLKLIEVPYKAAADHAAPPADTALIAFHLMLDLIVILCVWLVSWHPISRKGE